mmetsp:Transcript_22701/g.31671  ORF Transcript_22701/g.31671 Transcript_22701/m.31671 type:complete len:209 (+) Transcript_22701:930-1556(+)
MGVPVGGFVGTRAFVLVGGRGRGGGWWALAYSWKQRALGVDGQVAQFFPLSSLCGHSVGPKSAFCGSLPRPDILVWSHQIRQRGLRNLGLEFGGQEEEHLVKAMISYGKHIDPVFERSRSQRLHPRSNQRPTLKLFSQGALCEGLVERGRFRGQRRHSDLNVVGGFDATGEVLQQLLPVDKRDQLPLRVVLHAQVGSDFQVLVLDEVH